MAAKVLFLALLLAAPQEPRDEAPSAAQVPNRTDSPAAVAPIAVDWIHANDFSMIGLQPGIHKYHVLCGFRRGFSYLESRGVTSKYLSDGPLVLEQLTPHKLLFINLVSAEREPFLVSEIRAICAYVEQGGSLFIITDHSNCYFHAYRLKPLLATLGIRTSTSTACDVPPHTLGEGNAWISVTRFREHPVTAGLRCLGMQTGGCVDPRYAVALTSDQSWADDWSAGIYGDGNGPGFLGDFVRGPDESPGPLGVVLARTLGKGRVVIVADQNVFADDFINYADNYRLWLNVMAWLLRDDSLRQTDPYEQWKSPRIYLFESYERAAFARHGEDGFYHALSLINRYYCAFAGDQPLPNADLLVFARNDDDLSAAQLATAVDVLRRGSNLLVLSGESDALQNQRGIVARLLRTLAVDAPAAQRLEHATRLDLPSGGKIFLVHDAFVPNGKFLPPPAEMPDETGRAHNEIFLNTLQRALPPAAATSVQP
jgi:hypothetical protein